MVGASALELRDIFATPVAPIVPGALVQIVAAETLKQGRALHPLGPWPTTVGIVLLALAALVIRSPVELPLAVIGGRGSRGAVEGLALLLQSGFALLLDTVALQLALGFFLLRAMGLEIAIERLLRLTACPRARRDAQDSRPRDCRQLRRRRCRRRRWTRPHLEPARRDRARTQGSTGEDARKVLPWVLSEAVSAQFVGAVPQPHPLALQVDVGGALRTIEYTVTRSDVPGRSAETARRVVCVTFRDVTERNAAAQRLRYLADHDPMSGALSRHRLVQLMDEALAKPGGAMTVILVGLGRFKAVNATLGHAYGDQVLKQVAERLRGQNFTVARIGGTTFALATPGTLSAGALAETCRDLTMILSEPYLLAGGHRAVVTASVGGTTSMLSPGGAEVMLRHADMALAAAREPARERGAIFSPEMEAEGHGCPRASARTARRPRRRAISSRLPAAVHARRLANRWARRFWCAGDIRRSAIFHPPALFRSPRRPGSSSTSAVGYLEPPVGRLPHGPERRRLAVNVSPLQFELGDVLSEVVAALAESRLPPERLEIEITEGVFVAGSLEVIDTLEALESSAYGSRSTTSGPAIRR